MHAERPSLQYCYLGEWKITPDGKAYPLDCGNKWGCPQCSPKLLELDRADIARVLLAAEGVLFLTFSISHSGKHLGISLRDLQSVWSRAFSTGSWMGDYRRRTGMTGWARGTEITFADLGDHPHMHAVFTFDREPSQADEDALYGQWIKAAKAKGHHSDIAAMRDPVRGGIIPSGDRRERAAYYLTEQNAIRESKPGKGRTPGDLLHSFATTGDPDDHARLLTFHAATKGKQKIRFSVGFRQLVPAEPGPVTWEQLASAVDLPWTDSRQLTKRQELAFDAELRRETAQRERQHLRQLEEAGQAPWQLELAARQAHAAELARVAALPRVATATTTTGLDFSDLLT